MSQLYLFPVSAKSTEALKKMAQSCLQFLQSYKGPLEDLCISSALCRDHYMYRHLFVAESYDLLLESLNSFDLRNESRGEKQNFTDFNSTVFVFSGQGGQLSGVYQKLYYDYPVFKEVIDQLDKIYKDVSNQNLLQILFDCDENTINQTKYTQPVVFSFQIAMASLLKSWGIKPGALIGHSLGEFSAAAFGKVSSIEKIFKMVCRRAELMDSIENPGGMLAVFSSENDVRNLMKGFDSSLEISVINSPKLTVVSGAHKELKFLSQACEKRGIVSSALPVSHAFHSHLMDPILDQWKKYLKDETYCLPEIPVVSNLTGEFLTEKVLDCGYWARHLREPVLFQRGIKYLVERGYDHFIEISPRAVLSKHIKDCSDHAKVIEATGVNFGNSFIKKGMRLLYEGGMNINWNKYYQNIKFKKVDLPYYALSNTVFPLKGAIMSSKDHLQQGAAFESGKEEVIEKLCKIFSELLGVSEAEVDLYTSFLNLGADSFVLVAAIRLIKDRLGVEIKIRQLFESHNTIDKLSRLVMPKESIQHSYSQEVDQDPPSSSTGSINHKFTPQAFSSTFKDTPKTFSNADNELKIETENESYFSPSQLNYLKEFVKRYNAKTLKSKNRAIQSKKSLCNNRRSSSGFRLETKELLYPIIGSRSQGSKIFDIDENEYVDLAMGYGSCLFGHQPEFVKEALIKQISDGYQLGPESELVYENAEMIKKLTGMDRTLFVNTGTEAVFTAIRIARAATNKSKIILFENAYHGHFDEALVVPDKASAQYRANPMIKGVPKENLENVVVLPFKGNEAIDYIQKNFHDIAAVIVEPVQNRDPSYHPESFLRDLRRVTQDLDVILIFDEILVGFRVAPGGAQEKFGIKADMATYGKVIGGGLPVSVVCGAARWMNIVDGEPWQFGDRSAPSATTYTAGTFKKHPLAMAACNATLKELLRQGSALQGGLNKRCEQLKNIVNDIFKNYNVPIELCNFGSFFRFSQEGNLSFAYQPPELDIFFYHLIYHGVYVWEARTCFISTEHSDEDMNKIIEAVHHSVSAMKTAGFWSDSHLPTPPKREQKSILGRAVASKQNTSFFSKNRDDQKSGYKLEYTISPESSAATKEFTPNQKDPLDFGIYFFGDYSSNQNKEVYDLLIKTIKFADDSEFNSLWVPERHFNSFGGFSPNPSIILSALSSLSKQINVRGSAIAPLHHPVRLVEDWSVIDLLSRGRGGLALASGWHANDFILNPPSWGDNKKITFEYLDVFKNLWLGNRVDFRGPKGNMVPIEIFPKPLSSTMPLWLTSLGSKETYEMAGRMGVGILTNFLGQSLESIQENIKIYRNSREQAGLDPSKGHICILLHTYLKESESEALEEAREPFCGYLKSSIGLFQKMVAAESLNCDFNQLSESDKDFLLQKSYEKFSKGNALIGNVDSCFPLTEKLYEIGINEIACFVDFGVEADKVFNSLCFVKKLKDRWKTSNKSHSSLPGSTFGKALPLTKDQSNLIALEALAGEQDSILNEFIVFKMEKEPSLKALNSAYGHLVTSHSALRSYVDYKAQSILFNECVDAKVSVVSCSDKEVSSGRIEEVAYKPFTSAEILHRIVVIKTETQFLIVFVLNHLICDGFGMGVFIEDFFNLYLSFSKGQQPQVVSKSYFDKYIQWNHQNVDPAKENYDYWKKMLSHSSSSISFPYDFEKPSIKTFEGDYCSFSLESKEFKQLVELARKLDTTLFLLMLAIFAVTMNKFSGQKIFRLGVPFHGRSLARFAKLIGSCSTVLPIVIEFNDEDTFLDVLNTVREQFFSAFEHQEINYSSLLSLIDFAANERSNHPLYSASCNIDAVNLPNISQEGVSYFPTKKKFVKNELMLDMLEINDQLTCKFEFNTSLFEKETIVSLKNDFHQTLLSILKNSSAALNQKINNEYSKGLPKKEETPINLLSYHQYFDEQAEKTPKKIAIVDEDNKITFSRLKSESNHLAASLIQKGVRRGDRIGVYLPKSIQFVTTLLAIMKSGASIVPLDIDWPLERVNSIIEDSSISCILTNNLLKNQCSNFNAEIMDLKSILSKNKEELPKGIESSYNPEDEAYILYTSGSTGKPKGVPISQKNLAYFRSSLINFVNKTIAGEVKKYGESAPFTFDPSWQGLILLTQGVSIYLISDTLKTQPIQLIKYCHKHHIDFMDQTPSLAELTINQALKSKSTLPSLLIGGEPIKEQLWKKIADFYREKKEIAINTYGLTECTVDSTAAIIEGGKVNIGFPLENVTCYVIDNQNQIMPEGALGELCISGPAVFRGYLNREKANQEKFISLKLEDGSYKTVFKTGDLARELPGGRFDVLGRVDRMIKLSGYRIEPGEIESNINQLDEVKSSVVHFFKNQAGQNELICWVVLAKPQDHISEKIRTHLAGFLPSFMIPKYYLTVDEIPLNQNGKVDFSKLPELKNSSIELRDNSFEELSELQKQVLEILKNILNTNHFDSSSNFFEHGGNSLLAIKLLTQIEERFGVVIALRHFLADPTLEGIVSKIPESDQELEVQIEENIEVMI